MEIVSDEEAPMFAAEESVAEEPAINEDVAQNVFHLLERNLIPKEITEEELREALESQREFDKYTSPLKLDITHCDGGVYNIAHVNCYPILNKPGSYYVLYRTEAGVDGAVLDNIKTFTYKNGMLLDEPNPFKAPKFDEFFEGVEIPAELKAEANQMKKQYARNKNPFQGLDLRFGAQDDCVIEFRPSYIGSDELWDLANPVSYEFNGTTFVKMPRY